MQMNRRHALTSTTLLLASPFIFNPVLPSNATGLESIELPSRVSTPQIILEIQEKNKQALEKSEEVFQSSDLLKTLKERSDANREQRSKDLRDKYCKRQAELGVGDCAGLRLIPGMTQSGVQKRPEWLDKLVFGENSTPDE